MRLSVQGMIDEALKPKPRKRSGKFSPSSFGKCFRAQYWNRKDEPVTNPPDSRVMRVFKAGDLFHKFVQETIISNHPDIQKEVMVDTDPDVLGFCDMVNKIEVIEIKSQHSRAFHWMAKSKNIAEDKKTNWLQAMYYAIALGKSAARLVFISKDDMCIQEYQFKVDEYWEKEVAHELEVLRKWWEKDELPGANPRAYNGKECDYCNWRDKCKQKESQNVTR